MSAEAERMIRELHEVYVTNQYPSQSIYATPGEGAKWKIHETIRNLDGMEHPAFVESAARLGDFNELARVALTAKGLGMNRDQFVVARARNLLDEIAKDNPAMLEAFIAAQKGVN